MMSKGMGGITPMLTVNGEGVLTGYNAAAASKMAHLRIGTRLICSESSDVIDDPAHVVRFTRNGAEFFAYRPSPEYLLFPALFRHGGKLLSEGFIPCFEETDHAHILKIIASSVGESARLHRHFSKIESLEDALAKLSFILMMDIQREESVDVMALFGLLRHRIVMLFQHFRCAIRIDTVDLDKREIYPILPVLWLNLLIRSAILLLHASDNCRTEMRIWEENGRLYVEIAADSSLDALTSIAALELAFNRILAERAGMELKLGEFGHGVSICLSQRLCYNGDLVLRVPIPFVEQRREALLVEFDRQMKIVK